MGKKSKRNKTAMRILAFVLAFVVSFTGLPMMNYGKVETKAATNDEIIAAMTAYKNSFAKYGNFWNANIVNPTASQGYGITNKKCPGTKRAYGCTSNTYLRPNTTNNTSSQCIGFSRWFGNLLFNADPHTSGKWKIYTKKAGTKDFANGVVFSPEPGDIIETNGHAAVVWEVFADGTLYVAEVWGSTCTINWKYYNGNKSNRYVDNIRNSIIKWYRHPTDCAVTTPGEIPPPPPPPTSNIYVSSPVYPSGNLNNGQSFGIRGMVYSAYKLSNVTGTVYNSSNAVVMQKSVNPGSTSYDLKGAINNAMVFNNLASGSYRFVVSATDEKGFSKEVINSAFSVGSISQPSFDSVPVVGGVNISLSAPKGAVYYTLDGSEPSASSRRYSGTFTLTSSATVKAVAIDGGNKSSTVSKYIAVGSLSMPAINTYMGSDALTVNISADAGAEIRYTTDGSEPSQSSPQYYGAFQIRDTATIKAKAFKSGCANSSTTTATATVETPKTPTISISGSNKIATGDAVKVTWDSQPSAYSYTVRLYSGISLIEEQTIQGNACAFTLPQAGEYTITATAKNFKGTSAESYPPITVTAMEPSTVTFYDYDETVIVKQQVKYGYYAELPVNPSRRGYDFNRWDTNAIYQPIKNEVSATAQYSKKKYIVKFIDEDGKTLAAQQEVLFDESVVLPEDPTIDNDGYAFMGWRCISTDESSALDYEHVDANMTLQAVFDWGNKDIPVIVKIKEALQVDNNSYKVSLAMKNWPLEKTYARVLVTLKTSEDKMVKTITQDITLEPNNTDKYVDIDPITLVSDKVATKVEVNMVGLDGQKTAGAYSDSVTANTTSYVNTMWSEWSTSAPPAGTQYETKTQYSYRDRSYTTSTASSLAGWTQYGTPTTTYGGWSGTNYTTGYPGSSDTLQIVSTSTTYHYYHVCCNRYDGKYNVDSIPYGTGSKWHYIDSASPLPVFNMADKGGRQAYGGQGRAPGCGNKFYAWFDNGQTTTYGYQTRSKTVTYYYYAWGAWSGFGDSYVASGNDREVQTRTCYRYLINLETPKDGEDNTGETYTQEGTISSDVDLNGRSATILVYKSTNDDPTENQLEYVGQTTIGEGNAYSFTFKPMETPDEANSNYIVALSIEGQTNLYNIDVIYKTKPEYTVTFYDKDGNELSTCKVEENGTAEVPEVPEVEGYTFVGWDKDVTNVEADRAITAVYKPNEYSIVYVDWEADKIDMMQLTYGSELPNVEVQPMEGKTFLGWDKLLDGKTIVDSHMIIEAKYEIDEFTVSFVNEKGDVVSEQDVAYGQAAKLPENIDVGNKKFLGWSNAESWWYVTKDITVKPIIVYEDTATTPISSIEDTYIGGILTLSASEEESIYYRVEVPEEVEGAEDTVSENEIPEVTVSGNEVPEVEWKLYDGDVLLEAEEAVVYYYASAENKNDSEVASVEYQYVEVENPYLTTAEVTIPKVTAKAGEEVEIPVRLSKNPGLMGAMFEIEYDVNSFSDVSVKVGDVFAQGTFDYSVDEERGYVYVLWSATENTYETGEMFTLNATAGENLADGDYPMTLGYSQYDTFNDNWDDVKMILPQMSVRIGDVTYGDVNEDGSIGNKDVAFIARYLVDKEELSSDGLAAADVNRDGRVDNKDVAKLARYLVGKETEIGVQ